MPTGQETEAGFFFDGDSGVGDPGQVGPYSARDFAEFVRYGHNFDMEEGDRGVVRGILAEFGVAAIAAARQIRVYPGAGIVQGRLGYTTANVDLDVPENLLGVPRKDRLVLRRNEAVGVNALSLEVLAGDAANYPALTQNPAPGGVWEIPLWRWLTPSPFTDLTGITWNQDNDERRYANDANGAYAMLVNASGADAPIGSPVIRTSASDNAFTTSNAAGTSAVIGVTAEPILASAAGKVLLRGVGRVRTTGAVALMAPLGQSGTVGVAQAYPAGAGSTFGFALEASAGGSAWILALIAGPTFACGQAIYSTDAAAYATTSTGWSDVDASNITVTIPVYTGRARVMCSFRGAADNTASSHALFDLRHVATGVRAGDATHGLAGVGQNMAEQITIHGVFTGLAPGSSHVFRLQYRNVTAGATTNVSTNVAAGRRYPIILRAEEF